MLRKFILEIVNFCFRPGGMYAGNAALPVASYQKDFMNQLRTYDMDGSYLTRNNSRTSFNSNNRSNSRNNTNENSAEKLPKQSYLSLNPSKAIIRNIDQIIH